MEITFLNLEYLWLLWCLPLLLVIHFYSLKYIHNRAIKFANFEALQRVTGGIILSRNIFLLVLRLVSLLFLIFSLAGAIIWYSGYSDAADYVLAIDNSGSMLADDFEPNRLEAAKSAAKAFVDNLKADNKIGIVSFSGIAFVELSLTEDKKKIQQAVEEIQISSLHGTAISDALKTSSNLLLSSEKSRIIILLTDGQENIASEEESEKIIDIINNKHIIINTIGVATEEGGSLPGIGAVSTLDKGKLYYLANSTGGQYTHSETKEELMNAYESFDYEMTESKIPFPMRLPFILAVFFILFIEWILINTKYRTIP